VFVKSRLNLLAFGVAAEDAEGVTRIARGEEVDAMTVHARRYGRWCREHFDAIAAEGVPAPRGGEPAGQALPEPEPEPVQPVADQPQH
jgi:hypothetical protein